jgi:Ca-activated chloride channel family protein
MIVPDIHLIPLREVVSTDHSTTLDLLIKIIPPALEETVERPPLNIGLVLDRSGSMAGQKIEYVRQAATYAVEQLLSTDRVSVTIYDDVIETIIPSMCAVDKASIIRKIRRIYDRGRTALHAGWVQGGIQVSQHLSSKHLNRIILLSDGLANVGEINPDVIASDVHGLAERGVSTTTMGIGREYNEDLMEVMARSGDGNYYYIRSPDQLPSIFGIEMQGLMATMGNDVTLDIKPLAGVQIVELLNRLETNDNGQYRMPNLLFEQPVLVVARLKVPALDQTSELCKVYLSWHEPKQGTRSDCEASLELSAVPSAELEAYECNIEVRQHVALLMAARAREKSVELVARGDYEAARLLLDKTRQDMLNNHDLPMMASEAEALADLEKELKARNFREYRKMSKADAHSIHMSHSFHHFFYRHNRGPELGDITQQHVYAIVNYAGYNFLSHGPLSQSILRAAGPELKAELEQMDSCGYGEARITGGYDLPSRWVIHTVVPPWQGGKCNEEATLAQCYRSCLDLAVQYGIHTIAFPALGTGNLCFSPERSAMIAFQMTELYLRNNFTIAQIKFICFDHKNLEAFTEVFKSVAGV